MSSTETIGSYLKPARSLEAVKTRHKFAPHSRSRTHLRLLTDSGTGIMFPSDNTLCGKFVGTSWTLEPFAAVDCGQCLVRYEQRKRNNSV